VVATRASALPLLTSVTVVPITRTIRGIASEIQVGKREGLSVSSAANADTLMTIPAGWLDEQRAGRLSSAKLRDFDDAIRFALGCSC
jgi:mRNA interferase MazF